MPSSNKKIDFSLIIPAKNEEFRIAKTLSNYGNFFNSHLNECNIEILVVVADTKDDTYSLAQKYTEKYPFIKVLRTPYATGKGGAIALGFSNASGKFIGFSDADGAVSATEVYKLYTLLKETAWLDGVIGSRKNLRDQMSPKRRLIAYLYNLYVRILFGFSYQDTQCGVKIFKNKSAKDLAKKIINVGWTFDVNILLIAKHLNMRILECPVIWNEKEGSKFSLLEAAFKVPVELLRLKRAEIQYVINFPWFEKLSKKRKNVLIFSWRDLKHPEKGGAEVYMHNIAERLAKKYNVTVFTAQPGNVGRQDRVNGVTILRRGSTYSVYLWAFIYYIFKFRYRTDFIIDIENGIPFFTPLFSEKPKVLVVHHVHKRQWFIQYPWLVALFGYFLETVAMPLFYKKVPVVTVSRSSMKDLTEIGFASKRIFIGYNSVPLKVGGVVKSKYAEPTLLYSGRLKAYKRVELAIKLMPELKKKFPHIKLIVAGGGDVTPEIVSLVEKLNLKNNVELLGYISEKKKWELMQKAWVFLMPSVKEGWGITIMEAAKCATPSVGFDVPGVRDSIQDGHSGLIAKEGDFTDWFNKVSLLIQDTRLRKELGRNAKTWANRYKWSTTSKIFELLIDGKTPRSDLLGDKLYPWDLDIGSDFITTLADTNK